MKKEWKSYESLAQYLLNRFASEFGLDHVEGKQKVKGKERSGSEWEIDAKGVFKDDEGFLIVECRRQTKQGQSQESLGGLAYRILDTGAKGGIIVSPMDVQKGAKKVAQAENIVVVKLNDCTDNYNYMMSFFDKIFIGVSSKVRTGVEYRVKKIDRRNDKT